MVGQGSAARFSERYPLLLTDTCGDIHPGGGGYLVYEHTGGGATGKSDKLPCPGVKFLKMIPCPRVKSS